ncbi:unnamed protein product, partial [Meganyctiphanes norvegica]
MIGRNSILGHCIHMTEEELHLLRDKKAGIAHCPASNIALKSGLFDARRALTLGLKIGLGSDCAAGYNCCMLDNLRQAIITSNVLALGKENYQTITYKDAFRMATLGGAQALNMDGCIGNFCVGKEFDALLIDVESPDTPIDIFHKDIFVQQILRFKYDESIKNRHILSPF